jgi:hypothetical protein
MASSDGSTSPILDKSAELAPELFNQESEALRRRRSVAGVDPSRTTPCVGLALSGGGVRSATFAFGFLRGLAQNGLLPRFDYLSTVSGGGFAGSTLGRMAQTVGIDAAQEVLRRNDAPALQWLRRHGRYLSPRGARDLGMAVATYMRSAVSVHIEFGIFCLLVGLVVVIPHVMHADFQWLDLQAWAGWKTAWWALSAATWLATAPASFFVYWSLRDRSRKDVPEGGNSESTRVLLADRDWAFFLCVAAAAVLTGLAAWREGTWPLSGPTGVQVAALVLIGTTIRFVAASLRLFKLSTESPNVRVADERSRATRALRRANTLALIFAAAGLIDRCSWWLFDAMDDTSSWILSGVGLGGLLLTLRAFAEPLQKVSASLDGPGARWIPMLLNVGGIAIGACMLLAWVTLVQWLVFSGSGAHAALSGVPLLSGLPYSARFAAVLLALLAWLALTSSNRDTVNAGSLHNFYRARLSRAYLATGNPARFGTALSEALSENSSAKEADVTTVVAGDDVPMDEYAPELRGGPIHLIGVCLNQTREGASGLYNADRKGLPLTASHFGVEVGKEFYPSKDLHDFGSLSRWVGISGAAASPGAGSYTSRGWAALLFLLGARLGYWFRPFEKKKLPSSMRTGRWWSYTKLGLLAHEALASFGGRDRPWWFLSDGGHFDNTGVHALLRRRLDVIVLVDSGADSKFEFGDLENLVRKARIDFDTDIEFYTETDAAAIVEPCRDLKIISPESLADNYTARGVLMARVVYRRSDERRRAVGTLLVVKPNLHNVLDSDVLAYARRNPLFPHQPTSDQFFDEAQWESHHRLGEDVGRAMTHKWLSGVPGWTARIDATNEVSTLRQPSLSSGTPSPPTGPFWRQETKAAAVGATVGVSAIAALLVPGWQVFDKLRATAIEEQRVVEAALKSEIPSFETSGGVADPRTVEVPEEQLGTLQRLYEVSTSPRYPERLAAAAQVRLDPIQAACGVKAGSPACTVEATVCNAVCARPQKAGEVDRYWDFGPSWNPRLNPLLARFSPVEDPIGEALVEPDSPLMLPGIDEPLISIHSNVPPPFIANLPDFSIVPPAEESPQTISTTSPAIPASNLEALAPSAEECLLNSEPVTLYVQTYDEETTRFVRNLNPAVLLGRTVRVPRVENVVLTAKARGSAAPSQWARPTLLVHRRDDADGRGCAQYIGGRLDAKAQEFYQGLSIEVKDLPRSIRSERHVIELWLPPILPSAGSPEALP